MISAVDFLQLLVLLDDQGRDDVAWAENRCPPADAEDFALETIYVICNSGMRFTVARLIYDKVVALLKEGKPVNGNILGKSGKAAAIDKIWAARQTYFDGFMASATDAERLSWCGTIPWIGGITKYHLAKNFGVNVAKPDVHLQRLADRENVTVQQLCERLAAETGYRVATVDTILWRACATGILVSKTGVIREDVAVASSWH